MSQKLKFHQNWIVTKTKTSSKLKCHQNWNVTKTEILPNIIMSLKSKSKSKRLAVISLVLSSKSSKHLHSQTIGAKDLKFQENVYLPPCYITHVTCQVSSVTCHMSQVRDNFFLFFVKLVELVGWRSVIKGAYPVQSRAHTAYLPFYLSIWISL